MSGQTVGSSSFKRLLRIKKLVQLDQQFQLKDDAKAIFLGMSIGGVRQLRTTREYSQFTTEVLSHVTSVLTEQLNKDSEYVKETIENEVPVALQTLVELGRQRKDERIALSASLELLDRDPQQRFVKTSRIAGHDGKSLKHIISSEELSAADDLVNAVAAQVVGQVTQNQGA
jgi:hypothetical protein